MLTAEPGSRFPCHGRQILSVSPEEEAVWLTFQRDEIVLLRAPSAGVRVA
jgi:hypothetical protein